MWIYWTPHDSAPAHAPNRTRWMCTTYDDSQQERNSFHAFLIVGWTLVIWRITWELNTSGWLCHGNWWSWVCRKFSFANAFNLWLADRCWPISYMHWCRYAHLSNSTRCSVIFSMVLDLWLEISLRKSRCYRTAICCSIITCVKWVFTCFRGVVFIW